MTQQEEKDKEQENQSLDMEDMLEGDIAEAEKAEEELQEEMKGIGKIQDEINILKESLARSQADYQNLIRRVERDREDLGSYLTGNIVLKLIPAIDNLERIISATPEEEQKSPLFEGVRSIHGGILKTLEGFGVKPFVSVGNKVDANLHDVMTQGPGEEDIVIQEFEKGYMIGDKVLRHAKVVVGNGI